VGEYSLKLHFLESIAVASGRCITMKKLSAAHKRALIIRARKQARRNRGRKKGAFRARTRQERLLNQVAYIRDVTNAAIRIQKDAVYVYPPAALSLKSNADDTLAFLHGVRLAASLNTNVNLKLENVESISPVCAIMLASELDRLSRVRRARPRITDFSAWHPAIASTLRQLNVFKLANVVDAPLPIDDGADEQFIDVRSGQVVDMELAYKDIENEVTKLAEFMNSQASLYGAIQEAILNANKWAFEKVGNADIPPVIRKRWWFLASYNLKKRRFSFLVYDHGQGIPATMRRFAADWLRHFSPLHTFNDADAIEAAIKKPHSTTKLDNRGRGLKEMRDLLEKFTKGTLRIISGTGEYVYHCDGSVDKRLYKTNIGGTIVSWEIYDNVG